jgi:tetratricopeptide (TPR) repeat protein
MVSHLGGEQMEKSAGIFRNTSGWARGWQLVMSIGLVAMVCGSEANAEGQAAEVSRQSCLQAVRKEAIPLCQTLWSQGDTDLAVMQHLADAYIEEELFDEALQLLDQTRQRYPEARWISYKITLAKSLQAEKLLFAEDNNSINGQTVSPPGASRTNNQLNRLLCLKLKDERGLKACAEVVDDATTDRELLAAYGNLLTASGEKKKAEALLARLDVQKESSPRNPPESDKQPVRATTAKKETSDRPPSPPETTSVAENGESIADKLRKLKALYDEKLIDEVEYGKRKTALMDQTFGKTPAGSVVDSRPLSSDASAEQYGGYHALIIGVQDYQFLTKLQMARNDAKAVGDILKNDYHYAVTLLDNPTRKEILLALGKMRRTLTNTDNLLIYYAGHGWLDEEADEGYWLPINAAKDNDIEWLSLNSVISAARAIPAKHIMIVADSCFSGKLTRGLQIQMKSVDHHSKMATRKARVVLTSGGLEPVLDAGGGSHSVFAAVFLDILQQNRGVLDGTTLFAQLRREVMLKASQAPEYADIRKAGHEGGDYLFIRPGSKK